MIRIYFTKNNRKFAAFQFSDEKGKEAFEYLNSLCTHKISEKYSKLTKGEI